MASLKEIAEHAGLSIRTVNRVLKNEGKVKEKTRKHVMQAAAKLQYRPNLTARSLRTGKTYDILAVIGSHDELHVEKLSAFEEKMRNSGYRVNILFAGEESQKDELMERIRASRTAGVALFPGASFLKEISSIAFPVVGLDIDIKGIDHVGIDRQQGVYDAICHLRGKGYSRIAYLGPEDVSSTSVKRIKGYTSAIKHFGLKPKIYNDSLKLLGEKPDAVMMYSDVWAMEMIRTLHSLGKRIPDDLAIVGFDDRAFAKLATPPLTTVAQPNREVGLAAAEILMNRINGLKVPAGSISKILPMRLVIREST